MTPTVSAIIKYVRICVLNKYSHFDKTVVRLLYIIFYLMIRQIVVRRELVRILESNLQELKIFNLNWTRKSWVQTTRRQFQNQENIFDFLIRSENATVQS